MDLVGPRIITQADGPGSAPQDVAYVQKNALHRPHKGGYTRAYTHLRSDEREPPTKEKASYI